MKRGAAFISIVLVIGTPILCQNSRTRSQTTLYGLTAKAIQAESFALVSGGNVKARLTYDDFETSPTLNNDEQGYKRLAIGVAFRSPFGGPYLEMSPAEKQNGLNSMK